MRALIGSGPNAENRRREDAAIFPRAERGNVQLGHTAEQREHAVTLAYAALRQDIGKAIPSSDKCCIAEIADVVVAADPAQGELIAAPGCYMPVDRLMGNVETPSGQAIEQSTPLRPGKSPRAVLVIRQVRSDVVCVTFSDPLPFHD